MMRALAALMLLVAAPAMASLSPADLAKAVARPPAGATLPAGLGFTDIDGHRITLGAVADGRPLVLIFVDYTCRHVCAPGLALTTNALAHSGLRAGNDYRVAVIGIDPRDSVDAARTMTARMAIDPAVMQVTRVLLGDPVATPAAARALGYGYAYDAENDQFAHDASVYVFAADGRLRTVLPELMLIPASVKNALTDAIAPPSFADRVAHLCYGFAAAHGRFGRPIVIGLQALSGCLLLALGGFLWWRRRAA
jgi:protein SCO1/2